jgi:short-subunit dehydrogenase
MEGQPSARRPTALITGASSGIGAALADVFARHRHDLVLVARDRRRLDDVAARLRDRHQATVHLLLADLSQPGSARAVYDEVQSLHLEVDVLVNNAGMIVYGEFTQTDLAREISMIGVNLVALTELTKLFLPGMRSRSRGAILNLGSTGSFAPSPLNAVYSATKAYVLSFSEAIAEELEGTGITVTALCPGATRSELQRRAGMEDVRLLRRGVMDAAEVAEAGYRALQAGRRVEIPGRADRLQIAVSRFLPRRTVVRYAHRMLRRVE